MLASIATFALLAMAVACVCVGAFAALAGAVVLALATRESRPFQVAPRVAGASVMATGVLVFGAAACIVLDLVSPA